MITLERLKELLDFDPATGIFHWRISRGRARKGDPVGHRKQSDRGKTFYIRLELDGVKYYAHDLAWFWTYEVWPDFLMDHKDRNGEHNWVDNLRESTPSLNSFNVAVRDDSESGYAGVTKNKNKWQARIGHQGKKYYLGAFYKLEEAVAVRAAKAKELYGDFVVES